MAIKEQPIWDEGVAMPHGAESLPEVADVVIVGGGLTGITAAYLLAQEGVKPVIVEKAKVGRGATGVTTAFLTRSLDTDFQDMVRMFGVEKTKAVADSHAGAINLVEDIIAKEGIDCEFVRCVDRLYATSEEDKTSLEKEQKSAADAGLVMRMREDDLPFQTYGYLELSNQAKFHPLKYLAAVTQSLLDAGGVVVEEAEAKEILPGKNIQLKTTKGSIRTKKLLVATHAPFNKALYFKKGTYTSYILQGMVKSGALPEGIYEDTENPYHYFRIDKKAGYDHIILGGADHRSDIPVDSSKNFESLKDYATDTFQGIPITFERKWSGPIIEPVDGLAFIGPIHEDNILYATGFSGNGMTYSAIAARIMASHVLGQRHEWAELYEARRIPTLKQLAYKGKDYSGELVGGAVKNSFKYKEK